MQATPEAHSQMVKRMKALLQSNVADAANVLHRSLVPPAPPQAVHASAAIFEARMVQVYGSAVQNTE